MADTLKTRRVYRNIHVTQIVRYRLPPAGIVSILHRVSGAFLFLLMPFAIWMFDNSITSDVSFERFSSAFVAGIGFLPGGFVRFVVWLLLGAFVFHFVAGLRHLWMDLTHGVELEKGRALAIVVLAVSAAIWLLLGARLFGVY